MKRVPDPARVAATPGVPARISVSEAIPTSAPFRLGG
jgi:hypothetical protein